MSRHQSGYPPLRRASTALRFVEATDRPKPSPGAQCGELRQTWEELRGACHHAVENGCFDGRIAAIDEATDDSGDCTSLPWIAPGMIDLQVNGYSGPDFNVPELTVDDVVRVAEAMARFGVTQFCPTLTEMHPR